jgi:hypothetical protein
MTDIDGDAVFAATAFGPPESENVFTVNECSFSRIECIPTE